MVSASFCWICATNGFSGHGKCRRSPIQIGGKNKGVWLLGLVALGDPLTGTNDQDGKSPDMNASPPKTGLWQRFLRYFLAGVFTVLPLVLTIAAIAWTVGFLTQVVGPGTYVGQLLSKVGLRFVTDTTVAYIVGWIGLGAVILVVGFLVESGMRGILKRITKAVVRRIPLIGMVYDTSEQLVSMLDSSGDDKLKGMSVVYCRFGGADGVGVLALLPTNERVTLNGRSYNIVLIPQSPVPIGGALLFMPEEAVEKVDMTVDALMSIYVSMGVVAPGKMQGISIK
jgi:uncharacterized membrane protein